MQTSLRFIAVLALLSSACSSDDPVVEVGFCDDPAQNQFECQLCPDNPEDATCAQTADLDGDGIENAIDECPTQPSPASDGCPVGNQPADMDQDGVLDAVDNCPSVANVDQTDGDADGSGDLCDDCTATTERVELLVNGSFDDATVDPWLVTSDAGSPVIFSDVDALSVPNILGMGGIVAVPGGVATFDTITQYFAIPAEAANIVLSFRSTIYTGENDADPTAYDVLTMDFWRTGEGGAPELVRNAVTSSNLDADDSVLWAENSIIIPGEGLVDREAILFIVASNDEALPTIFAYEDMSVQADVPGCAD